MRFFNRLAPAEQANGRGFRGRPFGFVAVALMAAALSAHYAQAQPTLPLPAPGTPPAGATPPSTLPGTPGTPGDEARARAAAMAAKANIDVTDAWTKATAANSTTAPVYMHVVSVKDPDKLIGLEVANATRIDVREPTDQGAAKGNAAPAIEVPGGGTVNFAPGGRYLLLTGLKAPLREGDSFLVTLRFEKGGSQTAVVKVLGANAAGPAQAAAERRGDTTAGATAR
jgi:periplasmic copper chaperone A